MRSTIPPPQPLLADFYSRPLGLLLHPVKRCPRPQHKGISKNRRCRHKPIAQFIRREDFELPPRLQNVGLPFLTETISAITRDNRCRRILASHPLVPNLLSRLRL